MFVPCLVIVIVFWTSFAFAYWLIQRNLIKPLHARLNRLERQLKQPAKPDYTVPTLQKAPRSRYRSVEQQSKTEELAYKEQ